MREPVEIVAEAMAYNPVAIYVGYSGGDDSLTTVHWCMTNIPGCKVFHSNTGIGIERTRFHVRETCAKFNWPLVEIRAKEDCGQDYDELVIAHGFPGPAHHRKMYQRLKQRCIRELCRRSKRRYTREKILILTGIRQDESTRRMGYGSRVVNLEESVIWANPIYWWTKSDCMRYIAKHNLPRNPVSIELGMSGECLCGAFAHPGEKSLIKIVCPQTAARIEALEAKVRDAGHNWGWEDRPPRKLKELRQSSKSAICAPTPISASTSMDRCNTMADVTKLNRPLCASLLALAEKSTSGLWSLHVHRGIPGAHISEARTGRAIFWTTDGTETPDAGRRSNQDAVNDSALAVHAPTLAAQLAQALGEIDRLREEAERPDFDYWGSVRRQKELQAALIELTEREKEDAARKEPKP